MPVRTRSRAKENVFKNVIYTVNGVMQPGFPQSVLLASQSETMTDTVIPDYFARKKAGDVMANACSYTNTQVACSGGGSRVATHKTQPRVDIVGGGGSLTRYYRLALAGSLRPTDYVVSAKSVDALASEANAKAIADIDSSPYSFAEDIATWKQTANFLRDPIGSLRGLSKAFSSDVGKLEQRRKALIRAKAIADVWLTYRFAISPLIRSCMSALDAFADAPVRPKRRTARGSVTDTGSQSGIQTKGSPPNQYIWDVKNELTRQVRSAIHYEISNPVMDWRFKYGLRVKDYPELLWDLTPYSFMVDRITDVGNTIRGLTNLSDPTLSILAATWTLRQGSTATYRLTKNNGNSNFDIVITPDEEKLVSFLYNRNVWQPTWSDTIATPDLANLVNSATKIADLTALITQRLK